MEEQLVKKKLRIGVDLDDTLVNTIDNFVSFCLEKGLSVSKENMSSYYCWHDKGLDESKREDLFCEFNSHELSKNVVFFDLSKESLNSLKKDYNLVLITSRPSKIIDFTRKFIVDHFGEGFFEDIIHSGDANKEKKCKHEICLDLGIGILIDDRSYYASNCAQNGIKVLLLDKPWNKDCPEHENIIRVKDWNEILEKIGEMKDSNIVNKIKDFVKECFRLPEAKYKQSYEGHFVPMVNYSLKLAEDFGLDKELIEIAAWLHDIGSILYGRENHHITSSEIAEMKLKEFGYSEDKIELVKKCILNHRGSVNNKRESLEEQVIAEADVLSNFDNISGIFQASFCWENLDQKEARISVREKLKRKYNQLHFEESKKLIKPRFEAAMLLLEG